MAQMDVAKHHWESQNGHPNNATFVQEIAGLIEGFMVVNNNFIKPNFLWRVALGGVPVDSNENS